MRAKMLAAKGICGAHFEAFGTAGQAGKLKPIALEMMAEDAARAGSSEQPGLRKP